MTTTSTSALATRLAEACLHHPDLYFEDAMQRRDCKKLVEAMLPILQAQAVEDEKELKRYQYAGGFCEKHKPNGGARSCIICGIMKLSAALSQISYACEPPNEMEVSGYDVHCNEDAVVRQVQSLRALVGRMREALLAYPEQPKFGRNLVTEALDEADKVLNPQSTES